MAKSNSHIQEIRAEILAGRPFKLIAAKHGITIARVSQIRAQEGIPRRLEPLAAKAKQ